MKILHLSMGMPEFDRSARELGHEVERIHWPDYLNARRVKPHQRKQLSRDILQVFASFGPDLVFLQQHGTPAIDPITLRTMRDSGALVVNWCGDVREPLPEIFADYAPFVSVTAFTNWTDVDAMRAMGFRSEFIQIGYDETIYNLDGPVAPDAPEVVFFGNNYGTRFPLGPHRIEVVNAMRDEFGDRFAVYGRGWPGAGVVNDGQREAAIYRGAKVALNVDHFVRAGFFSDRLLRAMACGCVVVDSSRCAGGDVSAMVDRVRYFLESRSEASGMTNAQWAKAHTWHERIRCMDRWVSGDFAEAKIGPILADQ